MKIRCIFIVNLKEPKIIIKSVYEQMFESSQKELYYVKCEEVRLVNKAFSSLSFRGNRGYSESIIHNSVNRFKGKNVIRTATYGGILRTRNEMEEERYVLVQGRYTGKWSFPKGHSNEGETALECALREVGEETGIDELPEASDYLKIGYGNYFVFNLSEEVVLKARDKKEIMCTRWVTIEEMMGMSLNSDASQFRKILIENALSKKI